MKLYPVRSFAKNEGEKGAAQGQKDFGKHLFSPIELSRIAFLIGPEATNHSRKGSRIPLPTHRGDDN
jgi:hypothetical protein